MEIPYLWVVWLIIGIIFIIAEIFTPGFFIILVGFSFIFAGITALITPNIIPQIIVFIISTIVTMIFIRPICLKYLFQPKNIKKSAVDALIGREVLVDTDINNKLNQGYIKIDADYWKARSNDGSIIPKGTSVIVENFEGITATVHKI